MHVVQVSVQVGVKPKVKGEIDVGLSVKGKRWSCQFPFLRELAYIRLGIRAHGDNLSRDMKEDMEIQRQGINLHITSVQDGLKRCGLHFGTAIERSEPLS